MATEIHRKISLRPVDEESEAEKIPILKSKQRGSDDLAAVRRAEEAESRDKQRARPLPSEERVRMRSVDPGLESIVDLSRMMPERRIDPPVGGEPRSWGWMMFVVLLVIVAAVWVFMDMRGSGAFGNGSGAASESLEHGLEDPGVVNMLESVLLGFIEAETEEQMLAYSRHPERVKKLMADHYERKPFVVTKLESIESLMPMDIGKNSNFWVAVARLETNERREMLIELDAAGDARVDWEMYVMYQPMDWEDFVDAAPEGYVGDFRVYVLAEVRTTGEVAANGAAFKLMSRGSKKSITGHVRENEVFAGRFRSLLDDMEGNPVPLILRLRVENGMGSANEVLIQDLLQERWIYLDSPGFN